ncbi:MAG: SBBP repeat-containing protein [Candidatus Heimdallarchaeota archaeon]
MGKTLRLLFNHLVVILLIGIVLFSVTQHVFHSSNQTKLLASSEDSTATYLNLNFSTYLGGSGGGEVGYGIDVNEDGSCYVTGRTSSNDFPTLNAYNNTYSGNSDAIVAKLDGSGSLVWSTFFGGSDFDYGYDISIGGDGSCYIFGSTYSNDFPTQSAFNSTYSGNKDVIIAKFSPDGSLLWSTYLGGSELDEGYSIAVASDGSCYVTGFTNSSDFPTKNAYDSIHNGGYIDIFISKFSTNGTLLWSSFLGGTGVDWGYGIAVTSDGSCYVTGFTGSSDFPTMDAYDATPNGDWDVFVTKFNASGSILWSTYLGGTWWDEALSITTTSNGSCYVTGYTVSPDFPTMYAYNSTNGGWGDAFLTKFATNGSLLWSTFLGGNSQDRGYDVAVTSDGSCYVTGETCSNNFPTKNAYNSTLTDGFDAFVTCFSSGGFLHWSTYLGGSGNERGYSLAVTEEGGCFVTGNTRSTDFPTQNAYDDTLGATSDAFIVKFVDTPVSKPVKGFLVFIAVTPILAFMMVIGLILYKKRK